MSGESSRSRRQLLGRSLFVMGTMLFAPAILTAHERVRRLGVGGRSVLSLSQQELVRTISDTVLPETDTAGALTARADIFIADTLELWFSAAERQAFISELDAFSAECQEKRGISFTRMTPKERLDYLTPLDVSAIEARKNHQDPLPFFATIKELILIGYYTSAEGGKAIGYFGPMGTGPGRDGPLSSPVWI